MKILYHTQTQGFAKTHLLCPCEKQHKGCYSQRTDGSGYCFSCGQNIRTAREHKTYSTRFTPKTNATIPTQPPSKVVADSVVFASLVGFETSLFCRRAEQVLGDKPHKYYCLGGNGADVDFWYRDYNRIVRNGKRVKYQENGFNRCKHPAPFMHFRSSDGYSTPFFGEEHLKTALNLDVLVVESEKTVIYGQLSFPLFVWLGASGASGCTAKRIERVRDVLHGRKVHLLFDFDSGGTQGTQQAITAFKKCGITASALRLTDIYPDAKIGNDIADVILETKGVQL